MPRRTIAILFHENNRKRDLSSYAIAFLAEFWRKDGNRITISSARASSFLPIFC